MKPSVRINLSHHALKPNGFFKFIRPVSFRF